MNNEFMEPPAEIYLDQMRRFLERRLGTPVPYLPDAQLRSLYRSVVNGNTSTFLNTMGKETAVRDNIRTQILDAEDNLKTLYRKLKLMEKLGKESDYPVDSVIFFKRRFENGKLYTYCAVKTPVGWYITGRGTSSYTFEELVEAQLCKATEIWYATSWEEIG